MVSQNSFNSQEEKDVRTIALDELQVQGAKIARDAQARRTQGIQDRVRRPGAIGALAGGIASSVSTAIRSRVVNSILNVLPSEARLGIEGARLAADVIGVIPILGETAAARGLAALSGAGAGVAIARAQRRLQEREEQRAARIASEGLRAAEPVSDDRVASAVGALYSLKEAFTSIRSPLDFDNAINQLQDFATRSRAEIESAKAIFEAETAGQTSEAALDAGRRAFFNNAPHLAPAKLRQLNLDLHEAQRREFIEYQTKAPLDGG